MQVVQQRQSRQGGTERQHNDRNPVGLQKIVDRSKPCEAKSLRLPGRTQDIDERGQYRNAGQVGDDHAGAGDLAEFG